MDGFVIYNKYRYIVLNEKVIQNYKFYEDFSGPPSEFSTG
jgi:hypothetical protein